MPGKKRSRTMTPPNRSKKAHVAPPPKSIAPKVQPQPGDERELGEFSGQGVPSLQKK